MSEPPDTSPTHFSLHRWALERTRPEDASSRRIGAGPRDAPAVGSDMAFRAGVRAMLHWCSVNERMTIDRHTQGARVFAGFERISRVRPVERRYRRLDASVDRLVLFGQIDDRLPLRAQVVDVGDGPMAREWFLVIDAPRYAALLVARDLDGFDGHGPMLARRFSGLTAHDSTLVRDAADTLQALADGGTTLRPGPGADPAEPGPSAST